MKAGLTSLLVGILFGAGLAISGMTQPQKVIGFLDLFGAWDPSLAFVMMGAIAVHLVAYRVVKHRTSPFLADSFMIPEKKGIDGKLIVGSLLFGAGWGLGGFCPGPAITSLVSLDLTVFGFVGAMATGMVLHDLWNRRQEANRQKEAPMNNYRTLDPVAANTYLQLHPDIKLVDVRTREEFEEVHADGAINLPLGELTTSASILPRNQTVVVICKSGARSARACEILQEAGYHDLINVKGGTAAWLESALPVASKNQNQEVAP